MSMEHKIRTLVRSEIRALSPYHVPAAGDVIKLDAMENPYGWPRGLVDEWLASLGDVPLNRYPDPAAGGLCARLRQAFDVPADMGLLLGNGSDELIQMLAMAVAGPERTVVAPEPSFVMYRMIAAYVGMDYVGVPLSGADFSLDMPAMRQAIQHHQSALVFLAYPNNPTGNLFDDAHVHEIIETAPGLVVLDEAYTAFAGRTFMEHLGRYDNLLVLRTVSKMGLAGLRLGWLAGAPAWLAELDKVRLPYNINVLTQATAEFALDHLDVLTEQTEQIRADRDALFDALDGMPGVEPFPSQANFILFRVSAGTATSVHQGLLSAGILIKDLSAAGGTLADCLRVTVGRPEENARFLEVLRGLV